MPDGAYCLIFFRIQWFLKQNQRTIIISIAHGGVQHEEDPVSS